MAIKNLYASVTNTSSIESISVSNSYRNANSVAVIKAVSTNLDIGDAVTVDMGYTTDHQDVFSGYVKRKERIIGEDTYTITAYDELVKATDYFIVSTNPNAPFKRSRILAEDLIEELLALAGITNYQGDSTHFIYGYTIPVEVNLVGCFDFCRQLADMLAWHIYADVNGKVWFVDRKPYPVAGDTPVATITDSDIISIQSELSDADLRNRIVVYGGNGVYAEAKASSPYLPAGFYKTAAISFDYVDTQTAADNAASYNLAAWNRIGRLANVSIEGNPSIEARDIVTLQQTDLGIDSDWFVYSIEHKLGSSGYTTNMELKR